MAKKSKSTRRHEWQHPLIDQMMLGLYLATDAARKFIDMPDGFKHEGYEDISGAIWPMQIILEMVGATGPHQIEDKRREANESDLPILEFARQVILQIEAAI